MFLCSACAERFVLPTTSRGRTRPSPRESGRSKGKQAFNPAPSFPQAHQYGKKRDQGCDEPLSSMTPVSQARSPPISITTLAFRSLTTLVLKSKVQSKDSRHSPH